MATFLLVPGLWMGGWAWDAVSAGLSARGHRATAVTLPGLGETDADAAGIGLADHVDALTGLLRAQEQDVVLVAHSYAAFPAVGAADRVPEKVARLVFVDTGAPESGEAVITQMPHLLDLADGGVLPVPGGIDATHGVPDTEGERYRHLAKPHPLRTVTDPITLTGAWLKVPTTGVLCLAGGRLSLEVVRALYGTGDPRFAKLAEPGVTFFELATGHWPMLSTPTELTDVLVRAAAGEGESLLQEGLRR
ncbi:alpha/beta fold hydrolase [Streptomyces sp. NPDC014777]|uniref:alpha/beta fold hydrolase n=2 Tax=unclassified Streptomyces TaxID=2593676 RepID=UPI0036F94C05